MEKKNQLKAWLYLLPAIILLGVFMLYPLIDVFIYSFEENFTTISQTYTGIGFENYSHVVKDSFFRQAVFNTFVIVFITVPLSTAIALLISMGLNSIRPLRKLFETIFFTPYVTNTLAVGLVFVIMFQRTDSNIGLINTFLGWFGINPISWIDENATYLAKLFVLCFYVIWTVMPFKILILVGALQSVNKNYYDAAKIDGASTFRRFRKITLPLISPTISYLVITGFIGAFKEYNNAVAIFGSNNLNDLEMNTIVGYIYSELYDTTGGYYGYAASAAIILFAIVLTITIINLFVSKKRVHY